jgi:hypothetical protein
MADKQKALVDSIAAGVQLVLVPSFEKLADQISRLAVNGNATLARLETLEAALGSGAAPAKRAVRAGTAAKGTAKKATPKKGAAGEATAKVTNALLYFRFAMANDLDDAQEVHGTPENLAEAEGDPTVAKRDKEKEPAAYWSAVGAALWKAVLSDEQKDEVRAQFNAWKEKAAREGSEEPLEEEE